MKHKKGINIKNGIIKMKLAKNGYLYVLDVKNTLMIFDKELNLKGGIKIKLPPHKLYENTADISVNGKFIAIANKNKTIIYDTTKKEIKYQFKWHKGSVLLCAFDNEENYLLTGGMDGRAYIWSLKYGKMFLSLPPHPDYILSGDFSNDDLWTATGSYDRLISITNIPSPNIHYRKKPHSNAVKKIKFFPKNIMISGDKDGEIIKWDYKKGEIIKRFEIANEMIIDFESDLNEEFLFVITKEKYIHLYDFNTGEVINREFIKLKSLPSSITYNKKQEILYIGCIDGGLYLFDLLSEKKNLMQAIEQKEYSTAYKLIQKNPILKRTKEYQQLENIWKKYLKEIYSLLEKGELKKAKEIFAPFSEDSIKRSIFQNILKDYKEFEKFKQAVINKNYPLAYSLIRNHPAYKESIYYKQMEKDFSLRFNKAKELIKIGKIEEAKEILKYFRGVSEKSPLIKTIFTNNKLYELLKQKLSKRDFKEFFDLIKRNSFLSHTPEYTIALKYGEELKAKANQAIKEGNYNLALNIAKILKDFPHHKKEAEEIQQKAENIANFLMYMANEDYDAVEMMLKKYPYLEELDDYQTFLKKYKQIIKQAESFSIKGDVTSIKETFFKLANSKTFKNLFTQLIKRAYLKQTITLLQKNSPKLNKAIKNYIALFGIDNEIEDLIKIASKKTDIDIENYEKVLEMDSNNLPDFIWEDI